MNKLSQILHPGTVLRHKRNKSLVILILGVEVVDFGGWSEAVKMQTLDQNGEVFTSSWRPEQLDYLIRQDWEVLTNDFEIII